MNTYNIEEKDLGLLGIATKLTVLVRSYVLGSEDVRLSVQLQNSDGNGLYGKEMAVPAEVVADWGTDDSVIIDWVCTELGLTLA
jgi:hypothetical protein